jgi:hypothetical protein
MLWDFYSDTDGFYKSSLTFLTVFPCGLYKDFFEDPKRIQGDSTGLVEGFYNRFPKEVL